MRYAAAADTDIGLRKSTNQDSLLYKHASYDGGEIMMAVVCDGMGGLAKGELASAHVIRAFNHWFDEQLPLELEHLDLQVIGETWAQMLRYLNQEIYDFGVGININLGTTVTAVLMVKDQMVCVHVGDTRLYRLTDRLEQLTTDQTFVAREIREGRMTPDQAKTDRRRNMLLQCVGASAVIEPDIMVMPVVSGTYLLCSDGFRHVISPEEIFDSLRPGIQASPDTMKSGIRGLIEQVKARNERDNISAMLVYAGQ